ncbi:hypothetical protein [Sulfuricurvum sp.]|uniref:hypothetical protein n=1 Tax=Sulfuricurvum sp. TaxID=2025608 RepID=UPI003562806B
MQNMETFNYHVGYIFAQLQREFPRRVQLSPVDLIGAEECNETVNAYGEYTCKYKKNGKIEYLKDELDVAFDTIRWLYDTEYLIGSVTASSMSSYVTLSPKALELLKTVPSSLAIEGAKKTIGDELEEAFKTAAKEQISDVAKRALSTLFSLGWSAINSNS